jgi:hypothetical protein
MPVPERPATRSDDRRRQARDVREPIIRCIGRPAWPGHELDEKGATSMSTQINLLETEIFGTVPAVLVVLLTILAMLGIVANVAAA